MLARLDRGYFPVVIRFDTNIIEQTGPEIIGKSMEMPWRMQPVAVRHFYESGDAVLSMPDQTTRDLLVKSRFPKIGGQPQARRPDRPRSKSAANNGKSNADPLAAKVP
jgi:hypothetical protein